MKIMPSSEQLHLVWNNHMSNMQNVLFELYNHPTLADVTISCKDGSLKAHKIILSACSPYFETVFQENPCKHPVVILKETSRSEMQMLLQFMYKGATDIPEEEMLSVIHTANELRVKGFAHAANNKKGSTENSDIVVNDNREVLKDVALRNKHLEVVQITGRTSVEETQVESKPEHDGQDKCDKVKTIVTMKEKETRISALHSNKENDTESSENSEKCVHLTDSDTKSPSYSTRFRGRKRVAVGYRSGGRPRSSDKKDQEKGSTMSMRSTASKKTANSKSMGNSMATKLKSAVADTSKRKLSSDSEDERLISCIPDIEIKEEVDDSAEYSFMQSDFGVKDCVRGDQFIKEEPINNLLLRNPDFLYYDDDDFESDHVGRKSSALKPHECEFCELSFARASHLARHRRVHTGERPFSCEICQCRFSRQDKLKQHTRRHHPIDIQTAVQKKSDKRKRGRPRKIESETLTSTTERKEETNVSLPFGDTSYLSSLSLGQQRYKDQVASLEAASSSNAEDLLQTVRQLGECTIQAVPTCKFNV